MIKPQKIIVVGGNAAGPAAAAKAKRVNPSAHVMLFEAGNFISTGTCEIPYVLSGDVKDYEEIVFFSPEKFKAEKGADVFINHRVEEINTKRKCIKVKDSLNDKYLDYDYDNLILATGSVPNKIPSLSTTLTNVFNLTSIKDLIEIETFLKTNRVKNIAVIGSGFIGLEAADALNQKGYNVTIIEKNKLPLPYTEPEMQHLVLEQIKNKNIPFYGEFTDMKVNYDQNKVLSLNIDGRILEFDMIIVSVGFSPNVSLALQANLETGEYGGIKIDTKLKTSDPNIYAAGDNVEVLNGVTNTSDYLPFASLAHEYGHAAGENAAGGNAVVEPVIKNSGIKIFDKFLVDVGITSEKAQTNSILFDSIYDEAFNLVKVMPGNEKIYGKIIFEEKSKRILGASFFGGKEVAGFGDIISALIKLKQPVDFLGGINYNYSPPLSPFKNLLSKLGRKAVK
ncbi:MAG: FAD-dependent oxidoreductase [Ignavibacteriaceae bacterium]